MSTFALLTVTGQDRPGIVARVTQILFETGCNIADSSMTRLGGAFTEMLILRPPEDLTLAELDMQFQVLAGEMGLTIHIGSLLEEEALSFCTSDPEKECIISVLGADQPGIIFRVAKILAEEGGNVVDLHTRVVGSKKRPVYSMFIEAELVNGLESLENKLLKLARTLGVEISVRAAEAPPL